MKYALPILLFLATSGVCFGTGSGPLFVQNQGQWEGDFQYQVRLNDGAMFFEKNGFSVHLIETHFLEHLTDKGAKCSHHHESDSVVQHFAFRSRWIGANPNPTLSAKDTTPGIYNFILGNDPSKWKSDIKGHNKLHYAEVYPGIDVEFYNHHGQLKYDWHLKPGADISQIKWHYPGIDSLFIREGDLVLVTPFGEVVEKSPVAFQNVLEIKLEYTVKNDTVFFTSEKFDPNLGLTIDPVLVFSTYTGSTADNWGFTATYDNAGNFYAGGVAFGAGYPVTPGAFQSSYNSPSQGTQFSTDISISKINPTGTQLIYSTYLGGSQNDIPHSMVVGANNELIIYGTTGSDNYPVSINAVQDTFSGGPSYTYTVMAFNNGVDIVVTRLNAAGTGLVGSTYLGGTGLDGLNNAIVFNYGDQSRGEVVVDDNDFIYVASNTRSTDFPVAGQHGGASNGGQEAVLVKLNPNLTQMMWGRYFGGTDHETGFSCKVKDNNVYMAGGTRSNNLPGVIGGYQSGFGGEVDGYIAQFNKNTGQLTTSSYLGTQGYDQAFFIDIDRNDRVYILGQTLNGYAATNSQYNVTNGRQFIHALEPGLTQTYFYGRFGSGDSKFDIVPSAFMVDECLRIYVSGWGGTTNQGYPSGGNTNNMPITPDAIQDSTTGNDFYFTVFTAGMNNLLYGSFFGGRSREHVDGGTSRFSPEGIIYQAVCAGCAGQSFPTTPGVLSTSNNSNNCNYGGIKIDFTFEIEANAVIDTAAIDSTCGGVILQFKNLSENANSYYWDFGDGRTSLQENASVRFDQYGSYTIIFVAMDTICNRSDTVELTFQVDDFIKPEARPKADYIECDATFEAHFSHQSVHGDYVEWDFGDGTKSNLHTVSHNFNDEGPHDVMFVCLDSCEQVDTAFLKVNFSTEIIDIPDVSFLPDTCGKGEIYPVIENDSAWFQYTWILPNGKTLEGRDVIIKIEDNGSNFVRNGTVNIRLVLYDTRCNARDTLSFPVDLEIRYQGIFMPNAFSPNGDGINDELKLGGAPCTGLDYLAIFDRWGQMVFETDKPLEEFWDGYINGTPAAQGVYVYLMRSRDRETRGVVTLVR